MIKKTSFIFLSLLFFNASSAAGHNPHIVPGELLIKYRTTGQINKMSASIRHKASSRSQFTAFNVEHWQMPVSVNINDVMQQLKSDPSIEIVEPNYRRYPRATDSAAVAIAANARLDQINLRKLWNDVPILRTDKIKIAVIDDAFDIDHPDLAANITNTFDALDGDSNPRLENCLDEAGNVVVENHGTQVLGVVGAVKDNQTGLDGSANNAAIYPIRVGCLYTVAAELAAVNWAIQNDVDIINISYGGPVYSQLERNAFEKARENEIVVVVAAGNWDMDNNRLLDYPSGLDPILLL